MDRLSSCYFCGAALDASLSEYPVVPKRLQAESSPETRVVLCQTCRRKLATVLKEVVAAADDDPEDQSGAMDESGMDPQPDPMAVSDANETAESVDQTVSDAGLLDDGTGDADPERLLDGDGSPDQTTATEPAHPMAAADERTERAETAETTPERSHSASETTERGNDETDDNGDDGPSLTRLEYSKVMRLLQNRQFPVDRDEIRAVAVNAYDIEPEEFDAIIDAAVDRGLIGEANGQFVAPE